MYYCSICKKEVIVDHINEPVKQCNCVGASIITAMNSTLYGKGSLSEEKIVINNNFSEMSAHIIRNACIALAAIEFFQNNKKELFAKDLRVKDEPTGREFSFTITAKEL